MSAVAEELCRQGAAFVSLHEAGASWTIGNNYIRKTVAWENGRGFFCAATTNVGSGYTWQGTREAEEFRLVWDGTRLSGNDVLEARGSAISDGHAVLLSIELRLSETLQVIAWYRLTPENAVIQQWIEVATRQAGMLSESGSTLGVPHTGPAVARWVHGLHNPEPATEGRTYRSFQLHQVELGEQIVTSDWRSTWMEIPWFVLGSPEPGDGLFVGFQYSGRWQARLAQQSGEALVCVLEPVGLSVDVAAGTNFVGPSSFVGVFHGDLDDAAATQHRFFRTVLSPPLPDDFPWVQYNTWFSYFCDYDETLLRHEADLAADLGVEVFYIDAGWWNGSSRKESHFSSGLGNWQESRDKFPSGLRAFADHVRSRGMRFGIWVEPERVDLRTASTGTWKTEWLVVRDDGFARAHWPRDTETAWLCFGNAATRAWAVEWIARLVADLDLAWIKWDSNYWGVCTAIHHDHGAGDGEAHQVAGVHAVMDELRRRFPHLVIENCAGGGSRMDFAMAQHSHVAWVNDWSEPSHRVRFHLAGATYPFPPEILNTWVVETSLLDDLSDRSLPRPVLDAIFRSRMLGALGISCRLADWPETTRAAMRDALQEYKALRPLLTAGRIYHLLPQPDLIPPDLPTPPVWEAYQLYEPRQRRGAILVFRGLATDESRDIRLKGLDPAAHYTVSSSEGASTTVTGAALMEQGLRCDLLPLTSALIHFEADEASGAIQ